MFNTLKHQLHAFLFPSMVAHLAAQDTRIAALEEEAENTVEFLLHMDTELSDQRDQKIQAQIAVGHARTEAQELRHLDTIQKSVIVAINNDRAKAWAEAGKWKGAALEVEDELKSSFFEIAELNKNLERHETRDTAGDKTVPNGASLRLVA